MRFSSLLASSLLLAHVAYSGSASALQTDPQSTSAKTEAIYGTRDSWNAAGRAAIEKRANWTPNTNRAKNVILIVGDGMGISTLTASRIYEGQLRGDTGEENLLGFETFPHTALVKTYNVDAQVADSAGTASALNTGIKTRIGVINTPPTHRQWACQDTLKNRMTTLAERAEAKGMKTGIVSTARLTHATPAAVYAVSPNRDWENNSDLPKLGDPEHCPDIASQITGDLGGNGLEVALGGGLRNFVPEDKGGKRTDGRDITAEWTARDKAVFVDTADSLAAIDAANTDHLLGIFADSHLDYDLDRPDTNQPSLADMTAAALDMLEGDTGYYLMIEAGRIDHAHHRGNAVRALQDTVALSETVRMLLQRVNLDDTLILVTADHSHVFTIAGYPKRGNPILGLVRPQILRGEGPTLAADGKPYTTLGYNNGPGAIRGERRKLSDTDVTDPSFLQPAVVPLPSETHGGEDVALFAIGPWSHLARGTIEQNEVYHIMAYALGWYKN